MNIIIYELIKLLEKGNERLLKNFLEKHTIGDLLAGKLDESEDEYCLMLQAIKYKSIMLIEYLLENDYLVNEIDDFGRTTYNYLELYGNDEILSLFCENEIVADDNFLHIKQLLGDARVQKKLPKTIDDLLEAHKYTYNNGHLLFVKQECVCIYCKERFSSDKIFQHTYSQNGTALCPYCWIDSVIGEISGFNLTDNFIEVMNEYFFNNAGYMSNHIKESSRIDMF
ncbi:MAG: hypothetical protein ACOCUI_02780 [bacterium]